MIKIGFCGFHVPGTDEKSIFRLNNRQYLISLLSSRFIHHETQTAFFPSLDDLRQFLKNHPDFTLRESKNVEPFIIGEIGIWASWYLALSSFMQSDLDWLIIYEDDLWLGGLETIEFIDNVMREYLPPDADFLALSALEGEFHLHREELNVNQYISERFQECCLGLSAISKKAAYCMLEKMKIGIDNPIDLYIFNKEFGQKSYSLTPTQQVAAQISLYNQKWLGSTINFRKSDSPIYVPYPL
jgi:GR25 family glycosyltransferase involved in LPS biosynthesis